MESQQHLGVLEQRGGEPLEGSGFEAEQPTSQDELELGDFPDQRKGEEL